MRWDHTAHLNPPLKPAVSMAAVIGLFANALFKETRKPIIALRLAYAPLLRYRQVRCR